MNNEIRPVLFVPVNVWQKMMAFVDACPEEVNGFGYLEQYSENALLLTDVFILEQFVTPASANCSAETIGRHLTQMMRDGEDLAKMRFQWHSHVNGSVYYSSIDTNAIDSSYLNAPWMISMVLNKLGEHVCRIDFFKNFRLSLGMEVRIVTVRDRELEAFARQEIVEKVKGVTFGLFGRQKTLNTTPDEVDSGGIILEGGVDHGF
jgi:hypothetical protein